MSPERTQAYRRVIQTLEDLGPSKLLPEEQERIRFAADSLIFSADLEDAGARQAIEDVSLLSRTLVESERWTEPTAAQLLDDVAACGPHRELELEAA